MSYQEFVASKVTLAPSDGFEPSSEPHPRCKPHVRDLASWAICKGRAAVFASFGLHKTVCQLQLMWWIHEHTGGRTLIVAPLGVRQEFTRSDGPAMGMDVRYCRTTAEVEACDSPYIITNYERARDGQIDLSLFAGATLDEASSLRSYGTKTTQNFMELFRDLPYRFVATATPSPNDYIELLNYAHFLGVMDRGQAMTRFFTRDSKEAGNLQIMPSQEKQFWLWLSSWAAFVHKPSDLGHDDTGYQLPKLNIHWHKVATPARELTVDRHGNSKLFTGAAAGLSEHAQQRRNSLTERVEYAVELVRSQPDRHWLIWHDLESERAAIEAALPEARTVYGSQDLEERENLVVGFANGEYPILATKPSIAGSGCNFQRHCADAVFVGVDFKFNDVIQAVHRIYRFLQAREVNIHFVYADTQVSVRDTLLRKWRQHEELTQQMQLIVKEHGLNDINLVSKLNRSIHDNRHEVAGESFRAIHNDCVVELASHEDQSVHQIVTSIPFGNHYEYSPSYNDFGHNPGDEEFFKQMDFLIPELWRVLVDGRMACIHVKDRLMYGNVTGVGMYHVNPFSDLTVQAFRKHGFVYCGRIAIDTDVVRENAQTYRLGWTENAKDSTKMGVGSLEYVLLFRKWHPSMSTDGTAKGPEPVTKDNDTYTRSRWQIQASGLWKSSGDTLLDPDFLSHADFGHVRERWKELATSTVYDLDEHIRLSEELEQRGRLPSSWMLFAPYSRNPGIWADILRINTLNTQQSQKAAQNHICPLQLDVIERLIERYSNEGDVVLDPFGGVGSVPYQALKMRRRAIGVELNPDYWQYMCGYCEAVEEKRNQPTLFNLMEFNAA
jgi:DNA modification methylase